MRFALTPEQDEMQSVVRSFLGDREVLAESRAVTEGRSGYSPETWLAMSRDLGLVGVDVPDELGGTGMTAVELALAMEEAGAVLYPGPLLATTGLAIGALMEVVAGAEHESPVAPELLTGLCSGATSTLAISDTDLPWAMPDSTYASVSPDGTWAVTGVKPAVLHADRADTILVAAQTSDGSCVLACVDSALAQVTPLAGLDLSRQLSTVVLDQTPARLCGALTADAVSRIRARAEVCLAAESIGAARRCLDLATGYAGIRVQFGRPIGSFQAVKHRLADLLVEVELSTSLLYVAACHVAARDWEAARLSVPMASASASKTFTRAARESIQLHGGIAFTWEHDAHLYTRRAAANAAVFGSARDSLAQVYEVTRRAS